jgi:16S rRNA (adenine1518-N6/adenine1519-N6)-dimethyltransferase
MPGESVIEIGSGDGALTRGLAKTGGRVLAIEIDPRRAAALGRDLAGADVTVETGDALEKSIEERLREHGLAPPAAVVGNLPYNVGTPILRRAVRESAFVSRILATVQKEVARRFTARVGADEYGYLSVYAAFFANSEILFDLPPGAFRPRPKVTSSVLRLWPRTPALKGENLTRLLDITSRAFSSRRKTLPNALAAGGTRALWEEALAKIGKPANVRAEELTPDDFIALAREREE